MLLRFLCIGIACLTILSSVESKKLPDRPCKDIATDRALKKHPGCVIWWFLPGCVLGDRIAVDPFGIYPWEKFCRKYSDLQKHENCKGKIPQIRINGDLEEVAEKDINDKTADEKEANNEALVETETEEGEEEEKQKIPLESFPINDIRSNFDENDGKLISYIEKLEELEEEKESNIILDGITEPEIVQQRPKRNVLSRHVMKKVKNSLIMSKRSPSRLANLYRTKCSSPRPEFVKICSQAKKYLDSMSNSYGRNKRTPSIEQNVPRQRLTNEWAAARFYKTDEELHPGCDEFWFLPGCPLGNILGVDPLGQYPWEKLCDYPSLKNEPSCILYTQTSSQKYLGTRSRPQMPSSNSWPFPNVEPTENYPYSIKQDGTK